MLTIYLFCKKSLTQVWQEPADNCVSVSIKYGRFSKALVCGLAWASRLLIVSMMSCLHLDADGAVSLHHLHWGQFIVNIRWLRWGLRFGDFNDWVMTVSWAVVSCCSGRKWILTCDNCSGISFPEWESAVCWFRRIYLQGINHIAIFLSKLKRNWHFGKGIGTFPLKKRWH